MRDYFLQALAVELLFLLENDQLKVEARETES